MASGSDYGVLTIVGCFYNGMVFYVWHGVMPINSCSDYGMVL